MYVCMHVLRIFFRMDQVPVLIKHGIRARVNPVVRNKVPCSLLTKLGHFLPPPLPTQRPYDYFRRHRCPVCPTNLLPFLPPSPSLYLSEPVLTLA